MSFSQGDHPPDPSLGGDLKWESQMIECRAFYDILLDRGVEFFAGVPDSLLRDFCWYVNRHTPSERHVIAANEGGAIALACGYGLATGTIPVVYLQNAGQGNTVNPLLSLANPEVYGIPLLMLIGWRGEPGRSDEPQHIRQGQVTLGLLELMGIPYKLLPLEQGEATECLDELIEIGIERETPFALVVRKGTFGRYANESGAIGPGSVTREEAIRAVSDCLSKRDIVVATTGKAGRELYEYREDKGGDHTRDLLCVGSMGHASQIATGIAIGRPDRQVICLDGDGAALMHLGSLPIIGASGLENLTHVVLNNGTHDSVGGHPTGATRVSYTGVAEACGYAWTGVEESEDGIRKAIQALRSRPGPGLLEIPLSTGARAELGRPKQTLRKLGRSFKSTLRR